MNEIIRKLREEAALEAIEWAYKIKIMTGKYPCFRRFIERYGQIYKEKLFKVKKFFEEVEDIKCNKKIDIEKDKQLSIFLQ